MSGYIKTDVYVYRADMNKDDVVLTWTTGRFGASFNGMTNYIKPMLDSVFGYENVNAKDAIQLISTMMDCMSSLSKFWESRSIGGDIDLYVMFRDKHLKSGWIRAGQAIPVVPYGYQKSSFS